LERNLFDEFLTQQLAKSAPQFFTDFVLRNAEEIGRLLASALLAPIARDFRANFDDEPATAAAPRPMTVRARSAGPKLSTDRSTYTRPTGVRPKVCVAPGCTVRKAIQPGTGYTCEQHARAPKATRDSWRRTFIEEERRRLRLPPPGQKALHPRGTSAGNAPENVRTQAAKDDALILGVVKSQGKTGASGAEVAAATGLSMARVRMRTWRLRQHNKLRSKGHTSQVRYYLAH
jgi:hypothetical protein